MVHNVRNVSCTNYVVYMAPPCELSNTDWHGIRQHLSATVELLVIYKTLVTKNEVRSTSHQTLLKSSCHYLQALHNVSP